MPKAKLSADRRFRATLQRQAAEQLATDGIVADLADGVIVLDNRVDGIENAADGVRTVTSNDAFGPDDSLILVDASGGAVTLLLPDSTEGARNVSAKKIDASGNAVTLAPLGGDTLNGAATTTTQFATISASTDGLSPNWYGA